MKNNITELKREFPYLSDCTDFVQILAHVPRDVMEDMEEAIRLYQETDKIVVEADGGLAHVDGKDLFTSAIEWYCGMMDTADFIEDFGRPSLEERMHKASARAAASHAHAPAKGREEEHQF